MSNNKVVTNLRIDKDSWIQIKVMAAELGMSVNEYINYLIRDLSTRQELTANGTIAKKIKKKSAPIWNLGKITTRIKSSPLGELSSNDKLIYG